MKLIMLQTFIIMDVAISSTNIKFVRNVGNFLPNYMKSHPRRRKFAVTTARTPNLTALTYPLNTETCIYTTSRVTCIK